MMNAKKIVDGLQLIMKHEDDVAVELTEYGIHAAGRLHTYYLNEELDHLDRLGWHTDERDDRWLLLV